MERRKQKALKIFDTEASNEKKHRLSNFLCQKLMVKYGPKTKKGLHKSQIMEVVDAFLQDHPNLVKGDSFRNATAFIGPLSEKLKMIPKQQFDIEKDDTTQNCNSCPIANDNRSDTSGSDGNERQRDNTTVHKYITSPWMLIDAYKIAESEQQKQVETIKAREKKKEMARALDEQLLSKRNRIEKEKEENNNYTMIQKEQRKSWETEQKIALSKGKEKIEALKIERLRQIQEKEINSQREKQERRLSELKDIEAMKAALEKERQLQLEAKLAEKEKWEFVKEEHKKMMSQAKEKKEKEALLDAKLMEEMKLRADEQEAKRAKEMRERLSKIEENGKRLDEVGAFRKTDDVLRFEIALLKAEEERERQAHEEERKKKEKMMEKMRAVLATNSEIAKEKRVQIRMEKEETQLIADRLRQEENAFVLEQELNVQCQNEKKKEYRKILKRQINDKQEECDKMNQEMTANELSLNKTILEEAKEWLENVR